MNPKGAIIEIIERTNKADPIGTIVPNEVRINGQSLLCSSDYPVTVHEVSTLAHDVVVVTLTLLAKRVVFAQEPVGE
jgi:hypothetical protein